MKIYRNSLNLFDPSAKNTDNGYVENYALSNVNTLLSNAVFSITEYIPISASNASIVLSNVNTTGTSPAVCFYTDTKEFISGVAYLGNASSITSIPENAAFLRASILNARWDSLAMINYGTAEIPYEPYNVVDWYGYKYKLRASGAWSELDDKKAPWTTAKTKRKKKSV